ncbi:MAG: Holliday junction branch migration protein RuvA [Deltaproteobacteria bacterium]|nr:Holliday junction branch migration protein RuvA [Deltaproteobacteria bacterium]
MIAHIRGKLMRKTTESVIIDVNGVGYEVFIPLTTYYQLPDMGQELSLNVHTNVREDALQLYGFLTPEEKEGFQLLISVSGVGPKLARNILSGIPIGDLVSAIASSDRARLNSIPGIGTKSAERLIVELKDKVRNLQRPEEAKEPAGRERDQLSVDVISALDNLGYRSAPSEEAVKKAKLLLPSGFGFEELFKEALKLLSKK